MVETVITLAEARELYKQGGVAKEIALRTFTELEILNDYTKITTLFDVFPNKVSEIYAKLLETYRHIIIGRELTEDSKFYYAPILYVNYPTMKSPGEAMCLFEINGVQYKFFIDIYKYPTTDVLFDAEKEIFIRDDLGLNRWKFRDKEMCEHFVKHFYMELLFIEIGGLYDDFKIKSLQNLYDNRD